jgi:toxin ParE1/3/4
MVRPVTQRPRARLDLLDQFVYLGEQGGIELAERYLAAVDDTSLQLLNGPRVGRLYDSRIARLDGLRWFPVKGFESYLIFYMANEDSIDVIRVVHGARDIDSLFAEEES